MRIFKSTLQSLNGQDLVINPCYNPDLADITIWISNGGMTASHYVDKKTAAEIGRYLIQLAEGGE